MALAGDIAQGAIGALLDRPDMAVALARRAQSGLGIDPDEPWPTWKVAAAAGGVGVLVGALGAWWLMAERKGR